MLFSASATRIPSLSEAALLLLHAASAGQIGFFVARPAVVSGQVGIAWYHFNTMAMVSALAILAGFGAYRLTREMSPAALPGSPDTQTE